MSNNQLARTSCGPGMARRNFLRKSALLALPVSLSGLAGPVMAAVASANYSLPSLKRGSTVVSVRSYGALGNGDNDDTAAFQRAINALPSTGGTVDVPAGTYSLDPRVSVRLRSNMHLRLADGAILATRRNSEDRAYTLMLYKVNNVEISGGRLVGDRDNHLGTTGEWGHGIQVLGSTSIVIRDIHVSKCWGDGVCVGGAMVSNAAPIASRSITIANVVSTGNRRHGLTIANAHGVRVYDSEFSNCNGLTFGCGIDIEPSNSNTASDIRIENCLLDNNQANGIMVYKRVSTVTIKRCTITSNGGYGVLTIAPLTGYISQNRIRHNYLQGLMLRAGTYNYKAAGNYFRNNNTRLHGVKTAASPYVAMSGLVGGNNGNGAHIQKTDDCRSIGVTTNYYAK
ncbi:right-handed parallel beta-helix repeat-containing protein [Pseudoxanthomonas sp. UTMC 1351]|uniref:right-handed parallel beta-helix repeat-containing protein n=1 Tax=Pseudoxanthomonas sp. UTMC 1351 TaxID=2695853 RepID=UPI0034CFFBEF